MSMVKVGRGGGLKLEKQSRISFALQFLED
jgi:hypothetical protein